jgi:hypothetical protein
MNRWIDQWRDFWFKPQGPSNLGFCRFLYLMIVLYLYRGSDFSQLAYIDIQNWKPTWLFVILRLPIASIDGFQILGVVWKISLLLGAIGLLTRLSLSVSFGLGFYLLGMVHNWGKINHGSAIVILVLGVLMCSRCADGWSLDRLIARRRGKEPAKDSGEYCWPVRTVWLIVSIIMFAAGFAKMRGAGLQWMNGDNLAILLLQHQLHYGGFAPTEWGLWLARRTWLCLILSVMTIVLELFTFLAMFHWTFRWVFAVGGICMVLGFHLLLGPFFPFLMATYLFWVPWDRVGRWLMRFRSGNSATDTPSPTAPASQAPATDS